MLDAAEIKIYIDGVLDASMACVGTLTPNDGALYIGARGGTGRFLNGALDELRIYNYPLSDTEVEGDKNNAAAVEARGKMTTAWGSLKAAH